MVALSEIQDLEITFSANSSGSIGFKAFDLIKNADTPNTFLWDLTESDGTEINGRTNVVETPASTTVILLQGDDLPVGKLPQKLITVHGTYDTQLVEGGPVETNVPYKEVFTFNVI